MASIINATTTNGVAVQGDNSGSLQLQTNNGTTAVTIDTSQNVGIGTTSPNTKLEVNKAITFADIDTFGQLVVKSASGANGKLLNIGVDDTNNLSFIQSLNRGTDSNPLVLQRYSGAVYVGTSSAVQSTEKVAIRDTVGNAALFAKQEFGSSGWVHKVWNNATSGDNKFIEFLTETALTARGSIDYNRAGGQVRYNTTSDERLKENIVDSSSALPLINSVKIRAFDWKETGFHVEHGVIAQELETVAPDAVSVGEDNEDGSIKRPWGVDTATLVPAMIKAIQELKAELNEVRAELDATKAEIQALKGVA